MKKLLILIPLLAAFIFSSCKKNDDQAPVDLTFNTIATTLKIGSTPLQLSVAAPEEYVGNQDLVWTSNNTAIVTVSNTGVVTAIGPGIVTITGYVKGLNAVRGECQITVSGKIDTSIAIESARYEVNAGDTAKVIYSYSPLIETSWEFNVTKSDSIGLKYLALLTDNDDPKNFGQLHFKATHPGLVEVTLTNKVDKTVKTSFTINIQDIAVESFTFEEPSYTLNLKKSDTISATILPKAAAYRTVNYKSSDPSVFTVNEKGIVTPVAIGSAILYATTQDGQQVTTQVTIAPSNTQKINFAQDSLTVNFGMEIAGEISLATTPEGGAPITVAVDDTYTPESGSKSNISVVKANNGGTKWNIVTPFGVAGHGTARLIAQNGTKDKNDKFISDTCIVTVTGMDNRLLLTKSQYYGIDLGTKSFVTASASRFEFKPDVTVTLHKAVLYLPKGAMYYDADKKTNTKLKEDMVIETLTPDRTVNANSSETVIFGTIPSASHLQSCMVKYTFKTSAGAADASYTLTQRAVAGNGAPYSAPLR